MGRSERSGEAAAARHDLRAKLNHIAGYSEFLRSGSAAAGDPVLAGRCESLREAAFALVGPLTRLLADEPPEPAEARRIASEIAGILDEAEAEARRIEAAVAGDPGASADAARIVAAIGQVRSALPPAEPPASSPLAARNAT